jgi:glycosyltransferase involved in cell wall biosynthesis
MKKTKKYNLTNRAGVEISVVIAAYNEEQIIESSIKSVVKELESRRGVKWELISVNDGSLDRTGEIQDRLSKKDDRIRSIHLRRNFGQGRALRAGFDMSRGEVVITLDADLSYSPKYIYQLYDALLNTKSEIALASAYMHGGLVKNVPFVRRFLSRFGNYYLRLMMGYQVSTVTCVVRAYSREVVDSLPLTSDGMELQLEILSKAARAGFRIVEIPATLEWSGKKNDGDLVIRTSKMRILRTIRNYLLFGLLSRPAVLFVPISLYLIAHGSIMTIGLFLRLISFISSSYTYSLLDAMSAGLKNLIDEQGYSVLTASFLLVIGIQLFAVSMQFIQNQIYFDELSKLYRLALNKKG